MKLTIKIAVGVAFGLVLYQLLEALFWTVLVWSLTNG